VVIVEANQGITIAVEVATVTLREVKELAAVVTQEKVLWGRIPLANELAYI
jgi:hypothetical protein